MKLELTIPTDLNEITLGQYQQFVKVKETTNDTEMLAEKMIQIFFQFRGKMDTHILRKYLAHIFWI